MQSSDIQDIKRRLNATVVEKLLYQYFNEKGYEDNYDKMMYPPALFDLTMRVPAIADKVEVIPHTEQLDQISGRAVLGWNLFILGNFRMYLGQSVHNDLRSLASNLTTCAPFVDESVEARKQTTPEKIIKFIVHVLENHEHGEVNLSVNQNTMNNFSNYKDNMSGISGMIVR